MPICWLNCWSHQKSEMPIPEFKTDLPLKAHLVGVRGAGMRALAELLIDRGWTLSGSDQSEPESTLQVGERKIRIHHGHAASHVSPGTDVLIFSPAVEESNLERIAARQLAIPEFSYSQFLGLLMRERTGIAVAGTHGKTTTTAILATILCESGFAPSVAIGGEVIQYGRSGWSGEGPLLVVESCEYRRHFLDHSPKFAAILGIEPDHFDCFSDWKSQRDAFAKFAARMPRDGVLVIPARCGTAAEAALASRARIETVRLETVPPPEEGQGMRGDRADWIARGLQPTATGFRFHVEHDRQEFCETELRIPGRHNMENALSAIALAHAAGADAGSIAQALPRFSGVRRRFEIVETGRGYTIVDDYAHHPTAIRATLRTAREVFGHRRLVVAFQPHQISRTRELMADFAESFSDADEVFLVPIFEARESSTDGPATLKELTAKLANNGVSVCRVASLDRLKPTLDDAVRPDDVVLILGAGDISRIPHEFASGKIRRDHAG